jgi:hypothetical protein
MTPALVHAICLRLALVAGCLRCLRGALVTGCLKEWKTHPQEKDYGTCDGEWYMKTKKAITQVAIGAAKRLTERLIRSLGGWLLTHCLIEIGDALTGAEWLRDND